MAVLRAITGLQPGLILPIEGDRCILGRHPDCNIVLDSGAVSRQHAKIERVDGQYYLEDLQSRNGTFVNGEAVTERQPLKDDDELTICDLVFTFHEGEPKMPAANGEALLDPATATLIVDDERQKDRSQVMSKVDVSTGSTALALAVNPEAKLKALLEISQTLRKSLSVGEVLPKLLDGLFRIFLQADRGYIVLKDPQTHRLVPKAVKYRRLEDTEMIRISRTIVNSVMAARQAILSADAASDTRFDAAESIVDFQIRSMMCAPLLGSDGQALGVIQIDSLDQRKRFSRDDLEVLASVAVQAAFAVENAQLHEAAVRDQAIAQELGLAHQVQRGLLPAEPPKIPGYEFFQYYEAANELGGDYFDFIALGGGKVAVVVADVSGKGISASLLMARLSAETRFCLASEASAAAAVARLNAAFTAGRWNDRFVTFVVCVLDPARHEMTIVGAGHAPPLLRRRQGQVEAIGEACIGLPLGVSPDTHYAQTVVPIAPGDAVVLYTDGITDAMNPSDQLFGKERLLNELRASPDDRIPLLGSRILDSVHRFAAGRSQSDDICLVAFGRTAE